MRRLKVFILLIAGLFLATGAFAWEEFEKDMDGVKALDADQQTFDAFVVKIESDVKKMDSLLYDLDIRIQAVEMEMGTPILAAGRSASHVTLQKKVKESDDLAKKTNTNLLVALKTVIYKQKTKCSMCDVSNSLKKISKSVKTMTKTVLKIRKKQSKTNEGFDNIATGMNYLEYYSDRNYRISKEICRENDSPLRAIDTQKKQSEEEDRLKRQAEEKEIQATREAKRAEKTKRKAEKKAEKEAKKAKKRAEKEAAKKAKKSSKEAK
jgi:colicin import membrane protein